jgi:hypothetical protein
MSDSKVIDRKQYEDLRRRFCKAKKLLEECSKLIIELGNAGLEEEYFGNSDDYEDVKILLAEWGDRVDSQLCRWEKKR